MGLPLDGLTFAYLHLRRERELVQQLARWIAAKGESSADAASWRSLHGAIPDLEASLEDTNGSLRREMRVKPNTPMVQALVRGAAAAAETRAKDLEQAMTDFLGKSIFFESDQQRPLANVAFHSFRGTPIGGKAVAPVAFVIAGSGVLARLEVEVFNSGPKLTANHPEQFLEFEFKPQFTESIHTAFEAASQETGKTLCGRWRIRPWTEEYSIRNDLPIDGPSLGAAAARAWYFALSGRKIDPHVLVIARIGDRRAIEPLNDRAGVAAKVKAVCEVMKGTAPMCLDEIDTVVVVGDNDASAAMDALSTDMEDRVWIKQLDRPESILHHTDRAPED